MQSGIKFTSKSASKRPWQRVKYTVCPVRIALCEQEDGTWVISNCNVMLQTILVTAYLRHTIFVIKELGK